MAEDQSSAWSTDDLSQRLEKLWRDGQGPQVRSFVAAAGPLALADLAAVLRVDQRERWLRGERVPAETYLDWFPQLRVDAETAMELIYGEYLVRERLNEAPPAEEYFRRFPTHADRLRQQFELHQALASTPSHAAQETPSVGTTGTFTSGLPSAKVSLPEQFGRYRILKHLGQGGMGCVFLAHDTALDRRVALKVPIFRSDENAQRERFLREARSAATLDHPNVCSVYDVGQIDSICYLTMAYIDGQPLSKADLPIPQRRAVELVRTIALAMAEAHDHGIVHRDLKPANIMISTRGEPVVMDFGLARRSKPEDVRLTHSGALLGTPGYMSPEQAAGDQDQVGPGSDIYSLGVILYELLTGRTPFEGDSREILAQTLREKPRPPSALRVDVDPPLEAICLQMLEKKPADRPKTMRTLAEALAGCLPASPPAARAGRSRASKRRLAAVLGLASLAILGGVAVFHSLPKVPVVPTPPETKRAELALRTIAPARTMEHPGGVARVAFSADGRHALSAGQDRTVRTWDLETGQEAVAERRKFPLSDYFAFAPDGRRFAVDMMQSMQLHAVELGRKPRTINSGGPHAGPIAVAANGRRVIAAKQAALGEHYALVWDLETDQTFRFKGHKEKIQCVALSPDGRQGLTAGSDAIDGIRWWEVESGKELGRLERLATCLTFAPDASQALVGEDIGGLALWDLKTRQPIRKLEGHGDAVTCAVFAPDGRIILSGSADKSIRLWDAATGRELARLQGHTQKVTSVVISQDGRHALSGSADGTIHWWNLPAIAPVGP